MNRTQSIVIAVAGAVAGAAATAAAMGSGTPVGTADKAAIERIVHDYILANPEILPQAMERLQARDVSKAVSANRALIETPFAGAWEGAPDADVTVVQFFDYACGYCRQSLPDIDRLLAEDKRVKIVYRDMPVLGPDSEAAARLSLAAAKAGRYGQFHRAMYATGRPDAQARERAARAVGLDVRAATSTDVEAALDVNRQLQNALGLSGTPSWVVGDKVLSGAVGYDAIKAAVAEARAAR